MAAIRSRSGLGVVPLAGWALVAVALLGPDVAPALAGERASGRSDRLAARLLRLDPGARLGGNTQVATVAEARLSGVPGRMNVMVGLGPRETIVGGARHDELGVRGDAGRIFGAGGPDLIHGGPGRDVIFGGPGDDLISGGPGRDRLRGGPGRDRLIDGRGATTVRAGSGRDRVDVADGRADDRVLCAAGSRARIEADRGDRIGAGCRRGLARVTHGRPAAGPAPVRAVQQRVTGAGTMGDPFVAPCSDPASVDCTVRAFPRRFLTGLWANEYVPAYRCPSDHPYLTKGLFVPGGVLVPQGVEIDEGGGPGGSSWPVGIVISNATTTGAPNGTVGTGTTTGFANSTATNWSTGTAGYKVILHCTSDSQHAYVYALP
jgi:hypothetical protein